MPPVSRQHPMPFGSQRLADGQIRFRLWAPAARRVTLCLEQVQSASGQQDSAVRQLAMDREPDGWFSLNTAQAGAGSRYRFRIDDGPVVPDPASRYQPDDVHGPSEVIDPAAWTWADAGWRGRPWSQAALYELHVGTFTPAGTFDGVRARLDHLVRLGVTAIELMPVADFPGARNWGYDGVYPFAPDSHYGRPEALKALVEAAHARGLMVLLDVVYNHLGPEGNYLHHYAPAFFATDRHTPWGAAINFDGPGSTWVREFVIHNALFWLEEYHLDGLRLDAVHAIHDRSRPDILCELAERVQTLVGGARHVHLLLENDHNAAHYLRRAPGGQPCPQPRSLNEAPQPVPLKHPQNTANDLRRELGGQPCAQPRPSNEAPQPLPLKHPQNVANNPHRDAAGRPRWYTAQWNDDLHHTLHVLLTGEAHGYYQDYADNPLQHLGRCLTEGFAYQGECSVWRGGVPRGEPSAGLPATAFVAFLQNHDQVGNRPCGERIGALAPPPAIRAAVVVLLLGPAPPLLFMGEEWGSERPFPFFCDFGPDLAPAVVRGRRAGFAQLPGYRDPAARAAIPDPQAAATFAAAVLDWEECHAAGHRDWLALYRHLLGLRQRVIMPRLQAGEVHAEGWQRLGPRALRVRWRLGDGAQLTLIANFVGQPGPEIPPLAAPLLYSTHPGAFAAGVAMTLPPWSVCWSLHDCSG